MGPLIPNGFLPFEWNNVIAVLIGLVFGFILEASGFSSSKKLAGVFYGYDFVVLKVFFTAAVVSVIGLLYMDYLGWVNMSLLYIHPTYVWAAIVGGVSMGLGFILGGFCPGTSVCAAAIGKIDAIIFIFGSMVGVFIFSEAYPLIEPLFNGSYLGNVTVTETFGIAPPIFALGFTLVAIVAFFVTDWIRSKVKKVNY